MTLGKSFRQIFETGIYKSTIMGAWGLSELRWIKPVYPSDLLKTKINILEAKKSTKNPNIRCSKITTCITYQSNVIIMIWILNQMLKTRPMNDVIKIFSWQQLRQHHRQTS